MSHGNEKLYTQIMHYEQMLHATRISIGEITQAERDYGDMYGTLKVDSMKRANALETLIHDLRMAIK